MKNMIVLIVMMFLSSFAPAAHELPLRHDTDKDCYFIVERFGDAYVWDGDFDSDEPTWTDCAIEMAEHPLILGKYSGTFPSAIPVGVYSIYTYEQVGASPANTDTYVGGAMFYWTGTYLLEPSAVNKFATTSVPTASATVLT